MNVSPDPGRLRRAALWTAALLALILVPFWLFGEEVEALVADIEGVLETGTTTERSAAALALSASNNPEARAVLGRYPDLEAEVISGRLDWASIGAKGPT